MIQVHFANYSDKEEVLRKSKLLKGGTIHISEDFSRKVFFLNIAFNNTYKEPTSIPNQIDFLFVHLMHWYSRCANTDRS